MYPFDLLWAPLVAHNPNLEVVITHVSHICSQHSFELPLRLTGMHRMQFDHVHFDLLSLVIWSCLFWLSVKWNLLKLKNSNGAKVFWPSVFGLRTLRNLWLLLVICWSVLFPPGHYSFPECQSQCWHTKGNGRVDNCFEICWLKIIFSKLSQPCWNAMLYENDNDVFAMCTAAPRHPCHTHKTLGTVGIPFLSNLTGFSIRADSRWNSLAISHELAAYFFLDITAIFTNKMI